MEDRTTRRGALRAIGAGLALASAGSAGATAPPRYTSITRPEDERASEHVLTLEHPGNDGAQYEFAVEGEVARTAAHDASVNGTDAVDGGVARGTLGSGRDSYAYSGGIVRFVADGDVDAYVDGEPVDLSAVVDEHTLLFAARGGTDASARFELEATSDLSAGEALGIEGTPTPTGPLARGRVGPEGTAYGPACYSYTGGLRRFTATGDVVAYRDGRRVDLSTVVGRHTLTVDGTDGGPARYELETSMPPEQATPVGSSAGDETVEGTVARGSVGRWRDSYEFTGDLVRFTADGAPQVLLDGHRIDAREVVSVHTLTLLGGGRTARYSIAVDGDIQHADALGASLDPGDSVGDPWENIATGTVTSGRDSYTFTGDLQWVTVADSVEVILDGRPL
jgi:hypothetical protein